MLTRDFLMKADYKTAFGDIEESILWSPEQRSASLAATLAGRPDQGPVWLFGYGSLIWNPAFEYAEATFGTLTGWHRDFCLRLTAGRGTARYPGRMLGLTAGGETTGLVFRLPDNGLENELALIWKREMITGCYLPTWCPLVLNDGRQVNALVFIMDLTHPLYDGDSGAEKIAPLVATASGPLGSNAQYLFSLEQAMQERGMQDAGVAELARKVREYLTRHAG